MLSLLSARHTDDFTSSVLSSDMCAIDCSINDCFLPGAHYPAQQSLACVYSGMFDLCLPSDKQWRERFQKKKQECLKSGAVVCFSPPSDGSGEYLYSAPLWPCWVKDQINWKGLNFTSL